MGRGGIRKGAGRPTGRGPHGEATKPIRVPVSLLDEIANFVANKGYKIPLYSSHVQAGGPAPADEAIDDKVDLNEYLVKHPSETFMVRATGESMINAGISHGDVLIVDRSLKPANGKIVIAAVDGQLTVKRFQKEKNGAVALMPENPEFKPIILAEGNDLVIWGVVTNVIHAL
ncbi:MAG TPA: translesion error-prone DNA polymerase V autoproteolytic subunit [Rickettsiales bacterium]|nr:translesion error-prone DNA polymerase V autoproteolytic subunit [Rickettsiales bacterium]